LSYFKTAERGIAPQPMGKGARLSLIHVADLADALALALSTPLPASVYEIEDGRVEGYAYADMADAAGAALGRPLARLPVPRAVMVAFAGLNGFWQSMGGATRILTPGKVAEIFHSDWVAHDRRLSEATGFRARYDLKTGFDDTVQWYRAHGWLRKR
jgi:nucleoside-diphosphate-sugar epimerase